MRDVVISGAGITKFGSYPQLPTSATVGNAVLNALKDAGLSWSDIQAAYCGDEDQGHASGHKALFELGQKGFPIVKTESACASGMVAFRLAYQAVAGGFYDTVLAIGFEKMPRGAIPSTAFRDWQLTMGFNFQPANYALETRKYMEDTGTTIDDVTNVSVRSRKYGSKNPNAKFQKLITPEDVANSAMICDPFHLFHCSATCDGAVAFIITAKNKAKNPERCVDILATEMTSAFYGGPEYQCGFMGSVKHPPKENYHMVAAKAAYEKAGCGPEDIDVIQAYDSMAIAMIWDLEDMLFCKHGEAAGLLRDGYFEIDGKKPVNVDGGIMARGHAIGASGMAQIHDMVLQLRGEAGAMQVPNKHRRGLAHCNGAGPTSVVCIFGKD